MAHKTITSAEFETLKNIGIDPGSIVTLSAFGMACYRDNTVGDLIDAHSGPADAVECKQWDMSPREWHDGIREALEMMMLDHMAAVD